MNLVKPLIFLFLFAINMAFAQTTLITDGTWKGVGGVAPAGWLLQGYNDSGWPFVEAPNAGNVIPVVAGSQSIWVLPYDNTANMRKTFVVPVADSYSGSISINADNEFTLYFNGVSQGYFNNWMAGPYTFNISPALQGCVQNVIAINAVNWGGPYGASLSTTLTVTNPLNTPNATAETNLTCSSFTANWDSVPTADFYMLDVSIDPTFSTFYSIYQDYNIGTNLSQALITLPPGFTYYYRLRCQRTNALGTLISCYSNVIAVTLAIVPAANAGNDVYICPGSSTNLNATGAGTVSWSPGTGISPTNVLNPTVNPATTTIYTMTLTNGTCSTTDNVTVFVATLPPLVISNDTTICPGNCVNLNVTGGDYFVWSPYPGMIDSSLTTQTICPATTTTYSVTSYTVSSDILTNGDFSAGNTGFNSDYIYTPPPNTAEGQYWVATGAQVSGWNGGMFSNGDHTTGSGNFMLVNGSGTPNSNVWCQTISVTPNTDYLFSTWVSSLNNSSPAQLQFSINGINMGSIFSAPATWGTWLQFFQTWNSGANTSATICIVNQNNSLGGNDFGIDDISFSQVCTQSGSVDVTIGTLPAPTANNAGPYCTGDTLQLNSPSGSATDDWTGPGAYVANNVQNPTIPNSTMAMNGIYTVTVTSAAGCSGTATTNVVINPAAVASANNTGPYCAGDTIDLSSGAGASNYDWSGPGGFIQLNAQNTTIPSSAASMSGFYTITITVAGGCTGTASTNVLVNALPLVNANINTPVCTGQSFTLTGAGANNFDWIGPNGFNMINSPNPTINNSTLANAGIYTVTGTDVNGCSSTATSTAIINPSPTAAFSTDVISGCTPLCVNYTDNSTVTGSTIVNWNWNIESQNPSSSTNTSFCFNDPGLYDAGLTVTTAEGCTSALSLLNLINAVANPVADFTYSPQVINEMEPDVNFANFSFASTNYLWNLGDGTISNSTNIQHTYADTGIYCVTLLASNTLGCVDTITHCLIVEPIFTLYIPNSFTPNLDKINPIFKVYGRGIKTVEVYIFDRWGEEIFSFFDINSGWEGNTRAGAFCPQDAYVYRVVVFDVQNKEHDFMGIVNLIR